jgi:hypothetical protein
MILGFYQKIKGKPTNFREKILSCVNPVEYISKVNVFSGVEDAKTVISKNQLVMPFTDKIMVYGIINHVDVKKTFKPKRHTIREDKSNRWKQGRSIQMVYRGPKYSIADHFNKGIGELEECKATQSITIKWRRPSWLQKEYGDAIPPFTLKVKNQYLFVYIDNKLIGHQTLRHLAINDGFDSIQEFLHYFRKTIKDWKIIIWHGQSY